MTIFEVVTESLGEGGKIRFGALASLLCLVFCLGWDTAYVWFAMKHLDFSHMALVDVLPSAIALTAQAGFCATFYGINKIKSGYDSSVKIPDNGQK